jgi:hypothetical protein
MADSRLSHESIERVVSPTNPDYNRINCLVEGMPLCPAKEFRPSIYSSIRGRNPFASFELDDDLRRVLQIFRAIFLSAMLDELVFTRTLESFQPGKPQMMIEFDASLSGGGILYFDGVSGSYLGASTIDICSLNFNDESKFQNYAEFTVAVIGLIGALYLRPNVKHVAFRGDSISALTWLSTGMVKSDIAYNLSTIFIKLCVDYKLEISEVTHIPGVENTSADMLSRNGSISDVRKIDSRVTNDKLLIIPCSVLLSLFGSSNEPSTDEEFILFWKAIPIVVDHMIKSIYWN